MTNYGVITFDYENFNKFNKSLKSLKEETPKTIKGLIINMLKGLMSRYRDAVLESFIELWVSESRTKNYPPYPNNSLNRRKIIEMLILLDINIISFITALSQCKRVEKIVAYYGELAKKKQYGSPILLNQDISDMENRLFYLLYCLTSYCYLDYIESTNERKDFLTNLWTQLIRFVKIFNSAQHPNTLLWILEIYHIFSIKYLPKDVLGQKTIRSDMHKHMNPIFMLVAQIISKDLSLVYRPNKNYNALTILPLTPSVFTCMIKGNYRHDSQNGNYFLINKK